MATLRNTSLTAYDLTDEEQSSGSILNQVQKLVLQNEVARISETLLGLTLDTSKQLEFIQQQAYLKGQVDVLKWMLEVSDATERELQEMINAMNAEVDDVQPE